MTPLERRAAFKAAVTLQQMTMAGAATYLGVSYNHLSLVLAGERHGSARLEQAIADYLRRPRQVVFPNGVHSHGDETHVAEVGAIDQTN